MSCMCGDTHCFSCGPAQGNWRCPICRLWADDSCDHIEWIEDTPQLKPEYITLANHRVNQQTDSEQELVFSPENE